ncbi:MAG: hypothetical protein LC130_06005 [Bryobacterales bacterium]|nr:hypothetical protein [Bryobacterales bacterium]MEB2362027.1 hypothetical protein [Bryobacterales bacterium]
MRAVCALLCLGILPAGKGEAPEAAGIRTVYLMRMANGFEQYLANHLAKSKVYEVVTDPARAEAVLTDRVGMALQDELATLLAPTESQEVKEAEEAGQSESSGGMKGDTYQVRPSSFSRGRGNIFLVDLKTRSVLWSTYERPRNSTPDNLDKAAKTVISRLTKTVKH